jgi:DNA-binding LacI/PurR family transcriptional regulator
MTLSRARSMLKARGIRGVLVGNREDDASAVYPCWDEFAAVELGQSHPGCALTKVLGNHYGNAFKALQGMEQAGHTAIGLVQLNKHDRVYEGQMRGAFAVWQSERKQRMIPPLLLDVPAEPQLKGWLEKYQPEAILTTVPQLEQYAALRNLRTQQPVVIAEYRDDSAGEHGRFAMVENRAEKIHAAVDQLTGKLARGEWGPTSPVSRTLIDGEWMA